MSKKVITDKNLSSALEEVKSLTKSPHCPSALINEIHENGDKYEAVQWLQTTWNDYMAERAKNAQLLAEREGMLKDALRYRWLREGGPGTGLYVADGGNSWRPVLRKPLDTAIDAALAHAKTNAKTEGDV